MTTPIFDHDWTASAPVAAGPLNSFSGAGQDGFWQDQAGFLASVVANGGAGASPGLAVTKSGGSQSTVLARPASEAFLNATYDIYWPADANASKQRNILVRCVSNLTNYLIVYGGYQFDIYSSVSGTLTHLATATPTDVQWWSHAKRTTIAVSGTGPTTIAFSFFKDGAANGTASLTDSTSALQVPGYFALGTSTDATAVYSRIAATQTDAGGGALAGGATISVARNGPSGVGLTIPPVTGGTPPYSRQWYSGVTPVVAGQSAIPGATGLTLLNVAGDPYAWFFTVKSQDSAGTPAVITSATLGQAQALAPVVLGCIGDSITTINTPNAGAYCAARLTQGWGLRVVTPVNRGASGSTTTQWLPGDASAYYTSARAAFLLNGVTDIICMLGTNDASASLSAATYLSNLQAIATQLLADIPGARLWFNDPPPQNPGTPAVNGLLRSYGQQLDSITGANVRRGARNVFSTWLNNGLPGGVWYADSLHPNDLGSQSYGSLWASPVGNFLVPPPSVANFAL